VVNKHSFQRRLIQAAVAACFATAVHANPTGPSVVSGAATFNAVGKNLTVTNSPGAIIHWQGFSIRADEVTRFIQSGAASAVLNRVTGAEHSQLLGQLLSNGKVFLINPNGVTIGAGARIDTAGFVASSLALSNEDFLAGKFRFTDPGHAGKVTNAGTISAHSGGPVYLVAPTVENHGVITAPNGDVMLAAGKSVELVSAASPDLRVQVQAGGEALNVGQLVVESGRVGLYGAAVRNSGLVSADSAQVTAAGTVVLRASKDVTLEATSVVTASGAQGGSVHAQAEQGTLLADGRIEAKGAAARGGEVKLLGEQVGLVGRAAVDASGEAGGGTVLVGGDYQGGNAEVQNARATYVGADATLRADAGAAGDGGKIVVWADGATRFQGAASARGGATAGDGGFVEVSGKDWLAFTGRVDTTASAGRTGMLLLDPTDITISGAATSNGTCPPAGPCFTLTGAPATANLNVTDLQNALASTNVTVNTASAAASAGDITVANAITYGAAAARTLTLTADRDVNVNANIAATNNNGPLTVNVNAGRNYAQAAAATITTRRGDITINAAGSATLGGVNTNTGSLAAAAAGALTVNANGAVTQGGALDVRAQATFGAGAANDITLASATNNFRGNVRVTSGNDISIRDNSAFAFGGGASSVAGNLTVDSNGSVTQAAGATLAVGGTTVVNTRGANRDVVLNLANDFGGAVSVVAATNTTRDVSLQDSGALTLGTITISRNLVVTAAGPITQANPLTVTGATTLAAGAGNDITLANGTNSFGNVHIASGRNVSIRDNTAFSFGGGASSVSGSLTIDSNGSVTQAAGATVSVGGTATVNTRGANRDVTLAQANDFAGAVTVAPATGSIRDLSYRNTNAAALTPTTPAAHRNLTIVHDNAPIALPTKTLTGSLTLTAGGTITDTGTITAGTTTLTAGANDIALDGATNSFGNVRIVSGGNVAIRDNTAFSFGGGASTVSGNLAIDSNGNVTQAAGATVAAGGATTINTRGANRDVTLTQSNDFGGSVTIAPLSGNTRNVNLVDANGLVLGGASVATFQARTLAGDLTLTGPISATAGVDSIVLAAAGNFVNNAGAAALTTPVTGRWIVYSTDPAANAFGGLASGNQAIWNATYTANLPPTVPAGNRYVFATQPTLTFTSTDAAKVYGDVANVSGNYTVTGFVDAAAYGNVFTQDTAANTYTGTPTVASAGAPAGANAGVYPIVVNVGSVIAGTGYALAFNSAGQLTVNGRPITVRANDQARVYADPNPATGGYTLTAGSLAGPDAITDVDVTSPATAASGVGPYALTPTAANFGTGSAANYTITFADGVLTITPRPIVVTADHQAKVYGQPDPALTFTAPTVNGDVLSGALTRAPGETVPGSPYAITQGTVTNANNPNYAITFVNGQLVITPAPLTIAADNKTRLYGDANPPLTATFTGLANGDTAAAIPGVMLTTPAVPASNVGNYAINVTSGANANYTITYVNGQLAIAPAPLTIAANDAARPFGAPNPPFTATSTGFKLGQTVGDLAGTLVFATAATTTSPPGSYVITPGGASSGNYTITFVNGQLMVGQGAPPSDQALVTAVDRSESDPTAGLRPSRPLECLTVDRPGDRRVLSRCF
jgi:filamentous hemagglutinin family protein